MKRAPLKFAAALLFLAGLAGAISVTHHEGWLGTWFLLFIFIGLPLLVVTMVDLGHALRSTPNPSKFVLVLGLLFAVPQVLFALLTLSIGVALIGWVLYNSFVRRQPEYTGGFLTFGIGPAVILFGLAWLRQALGKSRRREHEV